MNTDEMNLQQAVNYSVSKIVAQGSRCMMHINGSADCAYGDGEGNHCSVGWLLDPNIRNLMEWGGSVNDLVKVFTVPEVIRSNIDVFRVLQLFHDAHTSREREDSLGTLELHGIDTSHEDFEKWVNLGE